MAQERIQEGCRVFTIASSDGAVRAEIVPELGGIVASPTVGAPGRRDTSRAHLAGAGAFSLDALRSAGDQAGGDR